MLRRQTTGSVVCRSCGLLVGVNDKACFHCGCRNPGLWGFAPLVRSLGQDFGFVKLVLGGCIGLYAMTLLSDPAGIRSGGALSFFAPSIKSLFLFGASGAVPVFGFGRWWTFLSAAWLHGGLLHIFFNMMWVRQLAPPVADLFGPGRMVLLYSATSVSGFVFSTWAGAYFTFLPPFLSGAQFTVGASAPIFGLLGALIYAGRRTGSSALTRQAQTFAVILFIFGFIIPHVDNWAHLGGFLGGYALARWLDPLKPERIDHLLGALICIVLTVVSIVISILHGLPLVQ